MDNLIHLAHLAVFTVLLPILYLPMGFLLPSAYLVGSSSTDGFPKLTSRLSLLCSWQRLHWLFAVPELGWE